MWTADLLLMRTKGARIIRAFTHLLRAGFIRYMNGKADFLYYFVSKLLCIQKLFYESEVMLLKKKLLFAVIFPFLFCGCGKDMEVQSRDVFAMDTYMNLKAYGENADIALDSAVEEIHRLESLLSVTYKNSECYKINSSFGEPVAVSDDMQEIIRFSLDMGKKTDGAFDITVYPLLKEWGFTTGDYKIPDNTRISELLEKVGYDFVSVNENSITLPENVQIDFGGVAKGYAADKIAEIFYENGVESALINLGGNVCAVGEKSDGEMWNVAVANPFSPDEFLGILEVSDKSVVTSGNYQRYFTGEDGKNYCHIIDTSNGYPAENGLVSVTVIADSGAVCDALSTAFFIMGREKTEEHLKSQSDISVILVEENGNIVISEDISAQFENLSKYSLEVWDDEN